MPPKKRKESKRSSRKPVEKPKQFCMKITSKKSTSNDKVLITKFVRDLYTNKRWSEPMDPDEFFVVMDTREKRVCIELYKIASHILVELRDSSIKLYISLCILLSSSVNIGLCFKQLVLTTKCNTIL